MATAREALWLGVPVPDWWELLLDTLDRGEEPRRAFTKSLWRQCHL